MCTLVIRPGEILESVARPSLFTMNEHAIANVYLDLSFLLRIMFVKKYTFTNKLLRLKSAYEMKFLPPFLFQKIEVYVALIHNFRI